MDFDFELLDEINLENVSENKKISDFIPNHRYPIHEAENVPLKSNKDKLITRITVLEPTGEKSRLFINER